MSQARLFHGTGVEDVDRRKAAQVEWGSLLKSRHATIARQPKSGLEIVSESGSRLHKNTAAKVGLGL